MARKKDYLVHIEPLHWERLKAYWSKPKTKRKAEQMSNTRMKVKNMGNVGQLGKARGSGYNWGTPKALSHAKELQFTKFKYELFFLFILDLKFKIPNEFYEL
jgi:hypothetical protein